MQKIKFSYEIELEEYDEEDFMDDKEMNVYGNMVEAHIRKLFSGNVRIIINEKGRELIKCK